MTHRTAARRYARALLDVAVRDGDPQRVEQDLQAFADLITGHPALARVLTNPAVPAARKRLVVSELLGRADGLSPMVGKLLLLLAERDRLIMLSDLLDAYRERLREHLQIVRAEITTALALPADRMQALEARLADATGKRVSLSARVDPTIIGGVVTRIGSVVYDGSVARQLARLKERLVAE